MVRPGRAERPARRQVDSPVAGSSGAGGDYNIWYHKSSWGKELGNYNKRRVRAVTKCNLDLDSGYTRGDDQQVPYICLHFARGSCFLGDQCSYLHRRPTPWDQARLDLTHDIFGRERHREDRADMGGVGCMNRENRTLYVNFEGASSYGEFRHSPIIPFGQITKTPLSQSADFPHHTTQTRNVGYEKLQKMIRKTFEQFGTVETLSVKMQKAIAFVTYDIRASAEFAKECMSSQSLLGSTLNEVLDVRWSYDDANPMAVLKKKRKAEEELAAAVQKKIDSEEQKRGARPPSKDVADEEDDIDRYLDDDPYYDLPAEEEKQQEEGGDRAQGEADAVAPRGEGKEEQKEAAKMEEEGVNPLGLIADYGSDSD
uniref:Pre-mRNA-splicing factor CWC2 n=1 Tax=Chloropicon primus TaxID=1764295 RepID=A0A7S2T5J2_9CHLO